MGVETAWCALRCLPRPCIASVAGPHLLLLRILEVIEQILVLVSEGRALQAPNLHEPSERPPGFGLRQPSGAFYRCQQCQSGGGPPQSKTLPRRRMLFTIQSFVSEGRALRAPDFQ